MCYAAYKAQQNRPTYQESNDSSSKTDSDDGNDGDDTGAGTTSLSAQETTHEQPPSPFMADQFTHCTQDQDHGGSTSPRIPSPANAPVRVMAPLLSGLMMFLSLAHINITSQTFRVSRLPGEFMSGLSPNFITCVTRTDKALLNELTSYGKNTRPTLFEPKVLC
jgi:hypothetical protein